MKLKTICAHCGKKQQATEINYSLSNVRCKKCQKIGELIEIK